MNESQLIPLFEIINNNQEMQELFQEYCDHIDTYEEFIQFAKMQSNYYPKGITRGEFEENMINYSFNTTINKLRNKLGNDCITEHTLDDGSTFYRIGNLSLGDFLNE